MILFQKFNGNSCLFLLHFLEHPFLKPISVADLVIPSIYMHRLCPQISYKLKLESRNCLYLESRPIFLTNISICSVKYIVNSLNKKLYEDLDQRIHVQGQSIPLQTSHVTTRDPGPNQALIKICIQPIPPRVISVSINLRTNILVFEKGHTLN